MSDPSYITDGLTPERCETECRHPEKVAPLLGRVIDSSAGGALGASFAILADPTRLRIIHALSLADELCVCDLALLINQTQSATSHQLRLLRTHRVVANRKHGRVVYYRLADDHVRHVLSDGLVHVLEAAPMADSVA